VKVFFSIGHLSVLMSAILLATCAWVEALADSGNNTDPDKELPEPHKVVAEITHRLLQVINDEKLDPVKNADAFYRRANAILAPVVAFDFIAKGVMGNYADQVTLEKRRQFTETFKKGLVSTYSKGVAGFSDSVDITTLKPEADTIGQRRVSVVQKVISGGATTYISYTMAQNRDNQWKLINVVLNGINLGKTFRGQFAQAVQDNQGDVAKVIDAWGKGS